MEAVQKKILKELSKNKKGLSFEELNECIEVSPKKIKKMLNIMIDELKIDKKEDNIYISLIDAYTQAGVLEMHETGEYGFVKTNKDDIYIHQSELNGAKHGDNVLCHFQYEDGKRKGTIIDHKKSKISDIIGEIKIVDDRKAFVPYNNYYDIEVIAKTKGLSIGTIASVEDLREVGYKKYKASVIKKIGHIDEPGKDLLALAYQNGIRITFPNEILKEIDAIPEVVTDEDIKDRLDLRNELIITMDCCDTKDRDDAISVKELANGNFMLGVHISDVDHYVKEGSLIDQEAYLRGTSSYLCNIVIPMLHKKLSNGICSLDANCDRLTISCLMEINNNGEVVNSSINRSVINSRKEMTYADVNQIIDDNVIPDGYEEYVDIVRLMNKLKNVLQKKALERGAFDISKIEPEFTYDEKGCPISLSIRANGTGGKIIETFMLECNETVAKSLGSAMYRIHEEPDSKKIENLSFAINMLGGNVNCSDLKTTKDFQAMLKGLEDNAIYPIASDLTVKSMKKARYSTTNVGHYGLALNDYCHFTSPIRRYPDLINHRLVKNSLLSSNPINNTNMAKQASYLSECEKLSDKVERLAFKMKSAEYMEGFVGEQIYGTINGMNGSALFVLTDNFIEGIVPYDTLGKKLVVETDRLRIRSINFSRLMLGDRVKVAVTEASKGYSYIEFKIIELSDKPKIKVLK